jgi:hypothetical protein
MDNVEITAGSGTSVATDEIQVSGTGTLGHVQFVKLVDGTLNGTGAIGGDAANGLDVDVTRLPALAAGTNNIGDVDVLTVPADPFGANADAASATGSISAKLRFIAATGIPVTGTVTVGSHAVTNAGTFAVQNTNTTATSGGASVMNATSSDGGTALTSTAQVIKASAGTLYGWYIYNPNSSAQFVQFYNTAQASVTVGTTNPLFMLTIPAASASNIALTIGINFSNAGWSWSATSTAGGNGAPTSALDAVCWYA